MPKHHKRDRSRGRSKSRSHKKSRYRSPSEGKLILQKQLALLQKRLESLENKEHHSVEGQRCHDSNRLPSPVAGPSGLSQPRPSRSPSEVYEEEESVISDGESENALIPEDEENTPPTLVGTQVPVSEDILALLGEVTNSNSVFGPPVHTDLKSRWENIIENGLSADTKKSLIEKYPPPENFQVLSPPILNQEIVNAINSSVQKRDERLTLLQKQMDAVLAAIGTAITNLLQEEGGGKIQYLELLSDAGRLMADLHYSETKARRELIQLNLDSQIKETLSAAPATTHLFGDKLDDRVTAAKNLKKFSQVLKPSNKTTITTKKTTSIRNLNYKSLPRQGQGYRQGRQQTYRQQQAHYNQKSRRSQHQGKTQWKPRNSKGEKGKQRRSKSPR
ncbi:unnamed protein product [Ceutorhynchus assimilis]|uniref:Uncharacterized protein n=1 Tax=Ceutorhynchus assimilis TaxID=467358 RepID=A0A9N9QIE6_9CUCU|nr:unnamed protein product [Ceutorhynchus assimilis]